MSYSVNVKAKGVVLRKGEHAFEDMYHALGSAALLASEMTARYSAKSGVSMPAGLAVEVVDTGGKVVFRLPIDIR